MGTDTQSPQSKAVAWLGVTGSVLLLVSATIFVWSQWQTFSNGLKFGIIALIAAACFVIGQWLSKSLVVMGSIFTHLSIFLIPIVLLSVNMEGFFEWRPFLIFEGFFCIGLFYFAHKYLKSPIFATASVLSTIMIALGLSSLEDSVLGEIPAAVYILPVVIGVSFFANAKLASLSLLTMVGFSPIIALFQPFMETGKEVVAGFGLSNNVRWYYSVIVAIGLLIAIFLNARTHKDLKILYLIPVIVLPYAIFSLFDESFGVNDLYLLVPVVLLVIQALLFLLRNDSFLKANFDTIIDGFNITVLIIQGYVAAVISVIYSNFLFFNYDNDVAFFEAKPAIGLLLMICVGIGVRLSKPNSIQDFFLGFLGMFSAGALLDLTQLIDTSHREVRMLIAAIVVCLAASVLKKNYLLTVLTPLTLITTYISLSDNTYNLIRAVAFIGFIGVLTYGLFRIRKTREHIFWVSAFATAIVLISFAYGSLEHFYANEVQQFDLVRIGFIFLIGLLFTEIFEYLFVGASCLFTSNRNVKFLRPARLLMVISYGATYFIGIHNEHAPTIVFAFLVVAFGAFGTWRRQESLPALLIIPTLVLGIYSLTTALNIESSVAPIFVAIAAFSLLGATYDGYANVASIVCAATFAPLAFFESINELSATGQSLFILGLVLIGIGVFRKKGALVPLGSITAILGLWITLAVDEVSILSAYALPVSLSLIAYGMYSRRIFPGQEKASEVPNSWAVYALPILLFEIAVISDSFKTQEGFYSLLGAAIAVLAISIGAWRKLSAPMMLGTFFLVVFVLREVFRFANAVPIWAWIGIGAFILILIAVVLEKSQITAAEAKNKMKVVIADDFQ